MDALSAQALSPCLDSNAVVVNDVEVMGEPHNATVDVPIRVHLVEGAHFSVARANGHLGALMGALSPHCTTGSLAVTESDVQVVASASGPLPWDLPPGQLLKLTVQVYCWELAACLLCFALITFQTHT